MEEIFENVSILLCEDDENLGMLLREYLEAKGFKAELCADGEEGYHSFMTNHYDLCILDVMMPKMDGFTLANKIHEVSPETPFIFLTAKTLTEDIRAGKKNKNNTLRQIGKFQFDTQKQTLTINDEQTKLTTKEAELLALLSNKANELLPRDYALKTIWIDDNYFNARSMDVYITKLRKHLKADPNVEILNVHGKGYKLVIPE